MSNAEKNFAGLEDRTGKKIALNGLKVNGRLHNMMAEIEVEQSYTNHQESNIEAIYTFPLPLGSALLGLDVEINGKKLSGIVVEKKQAERQYEETITDGDSAIMLEEIGPGLYTVSIGNLMMGESAVIRYRYALLLSWQGDTLRFFLPTAIAPRYGDSEAAGIQPYQIPITSLTAEYPVSISIQIEGELASALISSPSHSIAVQQSSTGIVVSPRCKAHLDRDFILSIQSEKSQSSCMLAKDGDNYVVLASLRIPLHRESEELPLALKIVIDCSGSMAGTSIAQARKASLEILSLLRPQDYFNVTLFGNSHVHFFPNMVPADVENIAAASNGLEKLTADMGGTEIGNALESTFSLNGPDSISTVLLITDGEIYEHEKLVKRAKTSGHRIFTVGVGNAVAEVFLKSLSSETDGACELVTPQEGMAERVLNQFHRMRQPKLGLLNIEWPSEPDWQTSMSNTVFAGDTVQVFAGFKTAIDGMVALKVHRNSDVTSPIAEVSETQIPRLSAARRMAVANEAEGLQLALKYQLLSRWTNFLVLSELAEKAGDLPDIHQVPQMLAADWGGTGDSCCMRFDPLPSVDSSPLDQQTIMRTSIQRNEIIQVMQQAGVDPRDIPKFLRKQTNGDDGDSIGKVVRKLLSNLFRTDSSIAEDSNECDIQSKLSISPEKFVVNLAKAFTSFLKTPVWPKTISELVHVGLDQVIALNLMEAIDSGFDEEEVVASFIYALSESVIGNIFSRSSKRVILKRWKDIGHRTSLAAEMRLGLASVTLNTWDWKEQKWNSMLSVTARPITIS